MCAGDPTCTCLQAAPHARALPFSSEFLLCSDGRLRFVKFRLFLFTADWPEMCLFTGTFSSVNCAMICHRCKCSIADRIIHSRTHEPRTKKVKECSLPLLRLLAFNAHSLGTMKHRVRRPCRLLSRRWSFLIQRIRLVLATSSYRYDIVTCSICPV